MKKYIVFFLSIIVLLGTILVYNTMNIKKQKELNFSESGYILNNLSDRYYFYEDEPYSKSYDDKIVFNDTEGEKVTIDKENFVHYTSGNVEALKDSVLLDLNNIDLNPIVYYNINANKEIKKTSNRYTIKNLKSDIQFDKAIWKISDNKYIILAETIKVNLSSGIQKEVKDYIEIEYSDNEIVNLYNQEISSQTISSDSYIELSDNVKINLGDKIVTKDGKVKMSLDNMIINSNDNVNIVDLAEYEEKNKEENNETEENDTEGGSANGSTIIGGSNSQTTNNSTTLVNGTDGEETENEEFEPSEIEYPKDSNETKVDETKVLREPIFKVENMNISANSMETKISIEDEDELLVEDSDIICQIRNDNTGKIVLREAADVVDMKININKENLNPNTQYSLTVSAKYTIDDTVYSKNFIYRTFVTSSVGVEIVKDMFTSDSMSFEAIIDKDSLMESAKVSIFDYYADTENVQNAKSTVNINKDMRTITFNGLDSNKPYKIKIHDVSYDNAKISWTEEYEYTTLKKIGDFNAESYIDKKNGNFNLYASNVIDTDGSIQSYEYCLYEILSNGMSDEASYRNKKEITEEIVTVNYNKDEEGIVADKNYQLKIIATVYDNEKYFEIEKEGAVSLLMPPKEFPTISWEAKENGIGATYIKGNIKICDERKAIDTNKKIKVQYKNSIGETVVYSNNIHSRDEEGNIVINIDLNNLKAKDTYAFEVYADVDIGEKNEEGGPTIRESALLGTIRITTNEYDTLRAMYSMNRDATQTQKFNVNLKLKSFNTSNTESIDNLSSLTLVIQASDSYSINNANKVVREINQSNYKTYNSEAESFKDLFNEKGINITAKAMGLNEGADTCFTIGVTMMKDSTEYKNLIPVGSDPINEARLQLSNSAFVKGNETYTAAWVTVNSEETNAEKKQPIVNEIKAKNKNVTTLNGDTVVGYQIVADFESETKKAINIVYNVYNEKDELILSKELEYTGTAIPTYELIFTETNGVISRGNKYKFAYKVKYEDGVEDFSDKTEKTPLKQEPVITMYAKDSYVDSEKGNVIKYNYSCSDPDLAIQGEATKDTNVKVNLNDGTELEILRNATDQEIELENLQVDKENYLEYRYKLYTTSDIKTKIIGPMKFSKIIEIEEDRLNDYIQCWENEDVYETDQIIRIVFTKKKNAPEDILERVSRVDITFELNEVGSKSYKGCQLKKNGSAYYVDFDITENQYKGLMTLLKEGIKDSNIKYRIKYKMYYDTGKIGFNGNSNENDTKSEYVAYVNNENQYLDLIENKWDVSTIGNAYRKSSLTFNKNNVISKLNVNEVEKNLSLSYGETTLRYRNTDVEQRHFKEIEGSTNYKSVNKKIYPSIKVENVEVTTNSAKFKIETFNVQEYKDVYGNEALVEFEVYKRNEETGEYTLYTANSEGKELQLERPTDENGEYVFSFLDPVASYKMKVYYAEVNNARKYYFDKTSRIFGKEYSFNTGTAVSIKNIEISYSANSYNSRMLNINYEITKGEQSFFDGMRFEFYLNGVLQASITKENKDEEKEPDAELNRSISIGIGEFNHVYAPDDEKFGFGNNSVFQFNQTYKLVMVPMCAGEDLEGNEKEFKIDELEDCETAWRYTRIDEGDNTRSIRINTTITDADCVIYGENGYGEIKIEAYYYDESGNAVYQDIYNEKGEIVTSILLKSKEITNQKYYIKNADFSKRYYFKYSLKVNKDNTSTNVDPTEMFFPIEAIANEVNMDKGIVTNENSGINNKYTTTLQFSNPYNLTKINLIQYTIYEYDGKDTTANNKLWKTGILKFVGDEKLEWEDHSGDDEAYYKLKLPFEFNQSKGYLITLSLYKTDYSINYANDIQRISAAESGDIVQIFNVYK